jgi:hypothetical protein
MGKTEIQGELLTMTEQIEIIDEPIERHLVKVRYIDEGTGQATGREYTYFSEEQLDVGDFVTVPVKDTIGKAQVTAVDVPESEIAAFKDKVKTIPAGSILGTYPEIKGLIPKRDIELGPEPYEKTDALLVVEQEAEELSVQVFQVNEITTPKLHDEAEKWLSFIRIQLQDAEKARAADVKKPNDYVRWINNKYREKTDLLRKMEQHCLKIIGVFRQKERERQEHEQAKVDRAAERQFEHQLAKGETPAVPVPVSRKVEGIAPTADTGQAKNIWGEIWDYEVIKPELLPREALMPNPKFLKNYAELYKEKAVMPGVRFFSRPKVQVRRTKVEEPK